MQYRRSHLGGGTYFFTVNLAERSRSLLVDHIGALRAAIGLVKQRHPFHIDAIAVLPDHLHAVWTLPPSDADYPTRWMLIKAGFSRQLPKGERINASRRGKGERGIWQRRYWEHAIRDEEDFRGTWITSITIRSSTAMSRGRPIGSIPASTVTFGTASCRPIGARVLIQRTAAISENEW